MLVENDVSIEGWLRVNIDVPTLNKEAEKEFFLAGTHAKRKVYNFKSHMEKNDPRELLVSIIH